MNRLLVVISALVALLTATPASAASFGHIPNVISLMSDMEVHERGGSWSIRSFGRLGDGYRSDVSSTDINGHRTGNRLAREGVFGRIPSVGNIKTVSTLSDILGE